MIIGLYCHNTKRITLFHVEDRKESTLLPLIDNFEEGSRIMSDKFSSYVNIKTNQSKLEQYGFHCRVVPPMDPTVLQGPQKLIEDP